MDSDSWNARLSSVSKHYQSVLQSRPEGIGFFVDMFMDFEEFEGDDDIREEFPCPFCSEYFDILGLCCHIDDEHSVDARNGKFHEDLSESNPLGISAQMRFLRCYMQRKRKSRKGGSLSTLSLLRRELRDGNLQSLFGGSSCIVTSTNAAPDPLLSSFILPMADESIMPHSASETVSVKKTTNENVSERRCYQRESIRNGSSNLLLYLLRIRRRRQKDPSLFRVCCSRPFLMTSYEGFAAAAVDVDFQNSRSRVFA
ncbi:hypothetical protein RHMOL_Rhmol11G0152500 [Rhododendron molle]|uniref:Uncharacterized protein n=1 Tax=Rhododendron molle TaxID=49168 RepID=A0ACC0LTF5_RHOML|nr:hypothetical protein RHMOL_Rhmol11G0152500 [Rhododendron molle]